MRKKFICAISGLLICSIIMTGCKENEKDIQGKSGDRSFSTNFLAERIRMVKVRAYDDYTYKGTYTFTGAYRLDGSNNSELHFSDDNHNYIIRTNKNIKDRPEKLKVYYTADQSGADTYSIKNLSLC